MEIRQIIQILLLLTTWFLIDNAQLQEAEDIFIVQCDADNGCQGQLVTDCMEHNKKCIIDCTKGDNVCQDAEFICHPNNDCTLLCNSTIANKPCLGTVLNATQSTDINVNLLCVGDRACEYMTIDTNAMNINLNVTVTVKLDTINPSNSHYAQYIAKHSEIYLPQSGSAWISCTGHSVCHSMKIYGNTSTDSTNLHFETEGEHSFKDSYISFPNDSDISILCGNNNNNKDILSIIDGACYGAQFNGSLSGINSDINIECSGDDACYDTIIIANKLSKSLQINGMDGNNILSTADIYCPSFIDSNCNINVHGNGTNMLLDVNIHSVDGFDDVVIQCDYTTSIQYNCYTNHESGPTLYCDAWNNSNNNKSCQLILDDIQNQWKCLDEELMIDNMCDDINYDIFSTLDTLDIFETIYDDKDIVNDKDNDKDNDNENIGLWHNTKGQIVLITIISILLILCIAVCFAKRESIHSWMDTSNPMHTEIGGGHPVIGNGYHHNDGFRGNKKGKYASLDEEDSILIVDDQSDEQEFEE